MKAISCHRPWAEWLILNWKKLETRRHNRLRSLVGSRLAIHATATWDPLWFEIAYPYLTPEQVDWTVQMWDAWQIGAQNGELLGTVMPVAHRRLTGVDEENRAALIWTGGKYGLFVVDPIKLKTPVPWRGKQYPFDVPDEVMEERKEIT